MTTQTEALKLALELLAVGTFHSPELQAKRTEVIEKGLNALAQPEQRSVSEHLKERSSDEPVAWIITDEKINSLQLNSIQRLIDRARHAHTTDIKLRINGKDEWYQADWLKHLTRTTPPQPSAIARKPLTDQHIDTIWHNSNPTNFEARSFARAIEAAHGIKGD